MNTYSKIPVISLACLALGACGSDGGGGVASVASVAPSPTYQTLAQLGGNRTYQSAGIKATYVPITTASGTFGAGVQGVAAYNYGSGITIAYTESTDSYLLTAPDGPTASFTPANVVASASTATSMVWSKSANNTTDTFGLRTLSVNGVALSYTLAGYWNHLSPTMSDQYRYLAVGGIPTVASDMPTSGSGTYATGISGTVVDTAAAKGYDVGANSTASFAADFGTGRITTAINMIGVENTPGASSTTVVALGNFNGSGTIAAGSPGFSGTLATTQGAAAGNFSGNFNGPRAAEMAYVWSLTSGNLLGVGTVWGKKN